MLIGPPRVPRNSGDPPQIWSRPVLRTSTSPRPLSRPLPARVHPGFAGSFQPASRAAISSAISGAPRHGSTETRGRPPSAGCRIAGEQQDMVDHARDRTARLGEPARRPHRRVSSRRSLASGEVRHHFRAGGAVERTGRKGRPDRRSADEWVSWNRVQPQHVLAEPPRALQAAGEGADPLKSGLQADTSASTRLQARRREKAR